MTTFDDEADPGLEPSITVFRTDRPGIRKVLAICEEAKKKNLAVMSGFCWVSSRSGLGGCDLAGSSSSVPRTSTGAGWARAKVPMSSGANQCRQAWW